MGGGPLLKPYDHEIQLIGGIVCRDGKRVRVIGFAGARDLQVGCTFISRDALLKLVQLSDSTELPKRVVQDGAE